MDKIQANLLVIKEKYFYYNEVKQDNPLVIKPEITRKASLDNEQSIDNKSRLTELTEWKERWFLSSNAKDIGTLYLMFALFSGLIGTAFSVLIRLELSGPGVQYIADNQLYNSIITAHAIVMIFFMVKTNAFMLNKRSQLSLETKAETNEIVINNNKKQNEYTLNNSKFNYVKIIVENPYMNREMILKLAKKQKGVYVWETLDGKNLYVGHSINLYNRISSYFMPSIINTKARKVLKYLNKQGFDFIKLTIYIMNESSNLEQVVELEQHFIDKLKPNLNVDLIASSLRYHEPMTQEIREKLRKQKGTPVYIYNAENFFLLHIFESKQHMYNSINIHHKTLHDCLYSGNIYLDAFFLSLDEIEDTNYSKLLTLAEMKTLVNSKRDLYKAKQPGAKAIIAEFKGESIKNIEFYSLTSLARHLKGDRQVIREYLKGIKSGYYRGKWKFTYKNSNV